MGYLREIIGTRSRHRRCRQAWASHLEKTKETILAAAERTTSKRKAVVLGSGLLFDIPLAELTGIFGQIVLVDICHLPSIKRMTAGYSNVTIIDHDLSGVVDRLSSPEKIRFIPIPSGDLPESDADLVISANVLSQLPHIPAGYLAQLYPESAQPELQKFAGSIVRHHLSQLEQAKGTVCLITETEHRRTDGNRIVERIDPLFGVDPGPFDSEWLWSIAPHPEMHALEDVIYRVRARITGTKKPNDMPS
jgi:hypothetical protein